ncbi:MAG: hypothetical protein A2148_12610 [Chloroflexi bacterium RBG_16_68_14]|nr:MAG: hypothetical protein A2148_12610 [Chloroflexi bacterium RBG_16_68_14]
MVGVRPSVSFIGTVLAWGALATMAVTLFTQSSGDRAWASGDPPDGVYCFDMYNDGRNPDTPKGTAHQSDDGLAGPGGTRKPETKVLTRIEQMSATEWAITSVAYRGPGGLFVTDSPTDVPCASKGDGNSLKSTVPYQVVDISQRPTAMANTVSKGSQKNLRWKRCQLDATISQWVDTTWEIVITANPPYYGTVFVELGTDQTVCTTDTQVVFRIVIEAFARVATKGYPTNPSQPDDWDSDHCPDWDELNPVQPVGRDPFNPNDCPVGGLAGLPEIAGAPLETGSSSGSRVGLIAGLAAGATAGIAALAGGVWHRRRRRPA